MNTSASFSLDSKSCGSFLASQGNIRGASKDDSPFRILNRLASALEIPGTAHVELVSEFCFPVIPCCPRL